MWFLIIKPFIMPVILGATLIAGGLYIKGKINDIAQLSENNAKLEASLQQQKEIIEEREQEFVDIRETLDRSNGLNEELLQNIDELQSKFNKVKANGSKRDFGAIARKKDKLIEKIINKGTKKVFDCFEDLSRNEANNNCNNIDTKS